VDPIKFPEEEGGGFDRALITFSGPLAHLLDEPLDKAAFRWAMRGTADFYGPLPETPRAGIDILDRDMMEIFDNLGGQPKSMSRRLGIPTSHRDQFTDAPMLEDSIAHLQTVLLISVPV
jgi:flavin reductase (DIM6/NTAB) family NADH-FMN oxidoreductase RutF